MVSCLGLEEGQYKGIKPENEDQCINARFERGVYFEMYDRVLLRRNCDESGDDWTRLCQFEHVP